jgi:IS30 family transposase
MKHLPKEQRYTISQMKNQGYLQWQIADVIGKDKSVVSRELNRICDLRNGEYKVDLAQRKYDQLQKEKPKKVQFTETVKKLVDGWLEKDDSPEQIAGRAKIEQRECVSHERIYQYVWEDKKHGGELHLHLRRKGRKYRKRGANENTNGLIGNISPKDAHSKTLLTNKLNMFNTS